MAERPKVSIRVVSQKGHCAWEHKVGDQWIVEGKISDCFQYLKHRNPKGEKCVW